MNEEWAAALSRFGQANERARRERLVRDTQAESIARFEELCRSVHAQFNDPPAHKTHPVGLVKFWKQR